MPGIVALLTDFGVRDAYVGMMKGVMLGIAPRARLVDISHDIAPQDIRAGAYALLSAWRYFPTGTVFCAVVDPGVGGTRRALAVRVRAAPDTCHCFVCPDNGLLTPIVAQGTVEVAVALDDPRYHLPRVSATFHGRDVFAPAAAHLAAGVPLEDLGSALAPRQFERIAWPQPRRTPDGWEGEVIHIDRFGNLVTNLWGELAKPSREQWCLWLEAVAIHGVSRTFTDVAGGQPVAYIGSSGLLELAIRDGNAEHAWHAQVGDAVTLRRLAARRP